MSEGTKKLKLHIIGVLHNSKEDGEKILDMGKKVIPSAIFIESPVRKLQKVGFRGLLRCFFAKSSYFSTLLFYGLCLEHLLQIRA